MAAKAAITLKNISPKNKGTLNFLRKSRVFAPLILLGNHA